MKRDPDPPTHPPFISYFKHNLKRVFLQARPSLLPFSQEGGHHNFFFSLLFCLEEIATWIVLQLCNVWSSQVPSITHKGFFIYSTVLFYTVTDPSARLAYTAFVLSFPFFLVSWQDVAWCKWLFVIKWLLQTIIVHKTSHCVCPWASLCVDEQRLVTSCVSEAAEETLRQHSDKLLSRAMGRNLGFFLTFFWYRPKNSNKF